MDVKNTKVLTDIRHIEGNAQVRKTFSLTSYPSADRNRVPVLMLQKLMEEVTAYIAALHSRPPATRERVRPNNSVSLNGRWKADVIEFLKAKGF